MGAPLSPHTFTNCGKANNKVQTKKQVFMATKSSIHIKPCNIASSEAHNRRAAEYMRHIGESRIYVVPELSTDNEQ